MCIRDRSSASAGCLKSTWIWRKSVRIQICTYTFGENAGGCLLYTSLKEEHAQGLEEGRREGLVEGCVSTLKETLLLFLKNFGEVPNEISEQIQLQQETEVLKHWMKIAFQSETLDEFIQKM